MLGGIATSELDVSIAKRPPRPFAAGKKERRGFADVSNTERMDEAVERNRAAGADRIEEPTTE